MQVEELAKIMTERFDKVDQRFDLSDAFVESELRDIKAEIKEVRGTVNEIFCRLDASAKSDETHDQEMTALGSQVSRHERWIGELADHANIALKS